MSAFTKGNKLGNVVVGASKKASASALSASHSVTSFCAGFAAAFKAPVAQHQVAQLTWRNVK